MGTRATYVFREEYVDEGKIKYQDYGMIYTQFDGYPDGVPMTFVDFLNSGRLGNGIGALKEDEIFFNGVGCMMAQLIAKFKDGPGQLYLSPLKHRGHSWEDYLYTFIYNESTKVLRVRVQSNGKSKRKLFEGTLTEYIKEYGED
jgi:hypothetical protein